MHFLSLTGGEVARSWRRGILFLFPGGLVQLGLGGVLNQKDSILLLGSGSILSSTLFGNRLLTRDLHEKGLWGRLPI